MPTIREFRTGEWQRYRALRLASIATRGTTCRAFPRGASSSERGIGAHLDCDLEVLYSFGREFAA